LIKLYIPLYIVLSLIFCFIYGPRIIPDLLIVLVTSCLYTVICYITIGGNIPFTKPFNDIGDAQSWKSLILLPPLGALAGLHYFLAAQVSYGVLIYLFVLVITNFFLWKLVFKRT